MLLHTWLHCYVIPVTQLRIAVLLCVQHNVKLCCLFSSWFAKEANVANNNNDQPMRNRNTISAGSQEMTSRSR